MAPALEQSAANSVAKYQSRTVRATFSRNTKPGSLVMVICTSTGGLNVTHRLSASGFTLLRSHAVRDLQLTVWFRQNCPAMSQISVTADDYRAMQLRLMEYSGVSQASTARDKFVWESDEDREPESGNTGTLAATGELAIGIIANQYASTTQSGFLGGLTKLYETTSPSVWYNSDWERGRVSIHQGIRTSTSSLEIEGRLSSTRRWISFLVTFRSGVSGPVQLSSTINTNMLPVEGGAALTVFGKLRSGFISNNSRMLGEVTSQMARIGPFNYQYRLGGWTGLLIGTGTPFRIESIDGLEGWDLRTSDEELPRGDGALRGVDLQTARQVMFRLNFDGTQAQIEDQADELYRTLIPQRDADWELIYRHPGRPLRIVYCRPTNIVREINQQQLLLHNQAFTLRAADPRHYSAVEHVAQIPVSNDNDNPTPQTILNLGNAFAYPEIRVSVLPTSQTVTRVELVNETADSTFDFRANIPPSSTLLGDMSARATGAPRNIVTIDGQSKYGAWEFPREAFRLNPGQNNVYLRTTPRGTPVLCLLRYRDTWSG